MSKVYAAKQRTPIGARNHGGGRITAYSETIGHLPGSSENRRCRSRSRQRLNLPEHRPNLRRRTNRQSSKSVHDGEASINSLTRCYPIDLITSALMNFVGFVRFFFDPKVDSNWSRIHPNERHSRMN